MGILKFLVIDKRGLSWETAQNVTRCMYDHTDCDSCTREIKNVSVMQRPFTGVIVVLYLAICVRQTDFWKAWLVMC